MKTKKSVKKRFWISRAVSNMHSKDAGTAFFCHSFGHNDKAKTEQRPFHMPLNSALLVVTTEGNDDTRDNNAFSNDRPVIQQSQGHQDGSKAHDLACRHPFYSFFYPIDTYSRNQNILARSGSAKKGFNPVIIKKCDKKRLLKCSPRKRFI